MSLARQTSDEFLCFAAYVAEGSINQGEQISSVRLVFVLELYSGETTNPFNELLASVACDHDMRLNHSCLAARLKSGVHELWVSSSDLGGHTPWVTSRANDMSSSLYEKTENINFQSHQG